MATTLKTKNSVTAASAPSSLAQGELAVNIADKKMWVGNASLTPVQIVGAGSGGGAAAGSNTQVQYNSSGALAGDTGFVYSGGKVGIGIASPTNTLDVVGSTSANLSLAATSGQADMYIVSSSGSGAYLTLQSSNNYTTIFGTNGATTEWKFGKFGAADLLIQNYSSTGAITFLTQSTARASISSAGNFSTVLDASIHGVTVGMGANSITYNTALGYQALNSGSLSGNENTAVGHLALNVTTSGAANTAVGDYSLALNTTGSNNSSFGSNSLVANTTGSANTSIGRLSLSSNTTGNNNTAVGYQAGYTNTTSSESVFVGYYAGRTSTGANNLCVGTYAGGSLTTGAGNTFVGANGGPSACGYTVTTGSKNTILGNYNGNQTGLDIRTSSNNIVVSDGDGTPRHQIDGNGTIRKLGLNGTYSVELMGSKTIAVGTNTLLCSISNVASIGSIGVTFECTLNNAGGNDGYSAAKNCREIVYGGYADGTNWIASTETYNVQGSRNAAIINVTLTTTATQSGTNIIYLYANSTQTGVAATSTNTVMYRVKAIDVSSGVAFTQY